jgi:hypothetical protein
MSEHRAWGYGRAAAVIGLAGLLVACVADSSSSNTGSASGGTASGPVGSSSGAGSVQSLVVDVQTGGTLIATPGNGIGIYVEYEAGGHWNVSWTCDTNLTNLPCNYVVDASVASGSLTNSSTDGFVSSALLTQPHPDLLEAVTTTTDATQGIEFDATAGAPVTVSVSLNAPVSFFFVQDGQVNGGYKGALTNPLVFQPSTP